MPLPKAYVDKEAFSRRLSELIRAFEPCPDKYDAVVAVQSVFDSFPYITIPADHIGDANQMVNNDYAGLKVKYIVRKASNGELVDDCFVLRPDKDQAAIAALNAYADATENQVLAADIRKWLSSIISAEPRVIKWREWNRIGAEEGEA